MSEQLRLASRRPNDSDSGSEEEKMSRIALSPKAVKLMKLCELEGYKRLYDLLKACTADSRVSSHLHDGRLQLHD